MVPGQNPVVKNYLQQLSAHLGRVPDRERNEILFEIQSHIAEAVTAGRSVAEVLERLGPPDRLARAYTAEMVLQGKTTEAGRGSGKVSRWVSAAGMLAATSLSSLVVIPTLGAVGLGFSVGGGAAILAGLLAFVFPCVSFQVTSTGIYCTDMSWFPGPPEVLNLIAIALGAVLLLIGIGSLRLLGQYFQFLIKAVQRRAARA